MKFQRKVTLYATDQCITSSKTIVNLTDTFISIIISLRYYVLFNVWTNNVDRKDTSLRKEIFQVLMNLFKVLMAPNKRIPNSFPKKLYNQIIRIYNKNNLYVVEI